MNAADRERILREIRTIVSRISESIKSSASELIESRRDWDGARWWRQARAAAGGPPGPVELRASSLPEGAARGYSLWEIGAKGPVSWPKWQDVTQGQLEVIPVVGAAKHHQFALQLDEFKPGRRVSLVREPKGPLGEGTVAVFDAGGKHRVGYTPRRYTGPAGRAMIGGSSAFVIWERTECNERVALRVCLVAPEYLNRFQRMLADLADQESPEGGDAGDPS